MTQQQIDEILQAAADSQAVRVKDVTGSSKLTEVVMARAEAIRRFKEAGLRPLHISRILGCHHSTIHQHLQRMRRQQKVRLEIVRRQEVA